MRRIVCVVLVALVAWGAGKTFGRTWTDKKGKQFEAELVEVKAGTAQFKRDDGKTVKIAVNKLSEEDQAFIRESASAEPAATGKPGKTKPTGKAPAGKTAPGDVKAGPTLPAGFKIDVMTLSVNKPLPPDPTEKESMFQMSATGSPGTHLILLVSAGERNLVGIDSSACKVTACTDDSGTDLSKAEKADKKPFGFLGGPSLMPALSLQQVRPDGHSCLVTMDQPQTPASGATKIHLQGQLAIQCGEGEKTDEQADVSLKSPGQVSVGPVPLKLEPGQGFGESKIAVQITAEKPLGIIKDIVFLNAAGKEIAQQALGSASFGFGDKMTYQRTIGLAEDVDKAKVKIVSFEKLDTVALPLDLELGVGF